jgi:hypothetical protein
VSLAVTFVPGTFMGHAAIMASECPVAGATVAV